MPCPTGSASTYRPSSSSNSALGGDVYDAVGHHLSPESEPFVEVPPHGAQPGGAEDERRTVVGVAHPKLAQKLRAYERFAQAHHVANVAPSVRLDHRQAAANCSDLKLSQILGSKRYLGPNHLIVVQLVERFQIDVIRGRLRERP